MKDLNEKKGISYYIKPFREVTEMKQQANERAVEVRDRDRKLREMESRLTEKEATNSRLTHEKEALNSDLRTARKELHRYDVKPVYRDFQFTLLFSAL